jgi:hypothetical protein
MNLYELETVYHPEPPHDRPGFSNTDILSIYVDRSMLTGDQNRLLKFVHSNPNNMVMINDRFAEPTIRALAVMLDIASQPWTCNPEFIIAEENKHKKGKKPKKDSSELNMDGDMNPYQIEVNKSWTYEASSYKSNEPNRIMNRIELYYETIMDSTNTVVRGWEFLFFIHDRSLCFDDGIGYHASQNRDRIKRKGVTNSFWQWELSTTDWIRNAVSPYVQMRFTTERSEDPEQIKETREAFMYPLKDARNPARTDRVFTFENARRGWNLDLIYEPQTSASSYFTGDGDFFRAFPNGARWIPPQLRNASAILNGLLERPAYAIGITVNPLESLMSLTMAMNSSANESPDFLLGVVTNSFMDLIKKESDRKNPECASRFSSWVGSDKCPPGIQACYNFIRPMIDTPVVPEKTVILDPSLSHFGNAVTWELMVFEQLFETAYLHTELLFDYINSVGAFRAKRTLRLHTLCLGPPASGKSWKQEMLIMMCCPETTKNVGHQTKRADTTNTNRDCTLRIMDEANEAMSDKSGDGSGRAELKQILTSGVTYTEQCVVDNELHTRETMETKSHLLVLLNANSNAAISAFPDSIVSRFMVRYIPERRRAGVIDPALRDTIITLSPEAKREVDRHQMRHAMAGLISHAIDVGWLPPVDMEYAIMMLDDILHRLREKGINPDSRSKQRFALYMRALTIWYAAYMVFQTNLHFEPGTPFKIEHILECSRYLRCSRELVYFAVTHMYDTLINVNAPVVCLAIKKLLDMQTDKGKHPKRAKSDSRPGEFDTDWYILHLPLVGVKDDDLLQAGVKQIAAAIEKSDSVVYSPEMVLDTLHWMMTQRTQVTNRAACRTTRARHDEIGILFSVNLIDGDAVNHVIDAVKGNMDDWIRETDERYVIGITYRDGIYEKDGLKRKDTGAPFSDETRMFPHIFKVINCKDEKKTNLPFIVRNPEYREPGYNTMFTADRTHETKPYIVLRLNLDRYQERKRMRALDLPETLPSISSEHVAQMSQTYPDYYAETHSNRFKEEQCIVMSEEGEQTEESNVTVMIEDEDDAELFYIG